MMRFKIYTHNNFQTYTLVMLIMITVLCITFPELIYLMTGSFDNFTHPTSTSVELLK